MKRLEIKKKHIYLALFGVFIGYIALRYYLKPELFEPGAIYYDVYNYKTSKIKPQKKIIKDINFEFIHDDIEKKPFDGQWKESIRTDIEKYGSRRILHVTFTDNSKADIPFDVSSIGPAFSEKILNNELLTKLSNRFPNLKKVEHRNIYRTDLVLMLYQGDTLIQIPEYPYEISFQVRNPKSGKLQTYYQYGTEPEFTFFRPVFFRQAVMNTAERNQRFFNAYDQSKSHNYWDTRFDHGGNSLNIGQEKFSVYLFYSDRFTNQPVGIRMTGNSFKTTITDTYIMKDRSKNIKGFRVLSQSKTYTDKNEYTTEILSKNVN